LRRSGFLVGNIHYEEREDHEVKKIKHKNGKQKIRESEPFVRFVVNQHTESNCLAIEPVRVKRSA
jgi:hypothetical protein